MTLTIALRNLLHDKVRLAVTLTGVVFAVVLIAVQAGLFVGFTTATSTVIDNTRAQYWICARGMRNFDVTSPLPQKAFHQTLSTPGVAEARRLVVQFANWKKPNGGFESVEVVGYEAASDMGGPWNVVEGDAALLAVPDTVAVDEVYRAKLGVARLGEQVEVNGHRVRVAAFTRGIRSFTTSPYIFSTLPIAQTLCNLREGRFTYVLVDALPGTDPEEFKRELARRVDGVDVYTSREFSRKTQQYWMFTTGAGMALLIAAALGLVVGVVVVAQTLYATTMDHLAEFGTLRAMGAPGGYIHRIIVLQALASAFAGYTPGIALSYLLVGLAEKGGASILLPSWLAVGLFFVTTGMCVGASLISINKVTRIDPVMVFKGR
ncbi:putative ABC transporter permease [Fundidesulfovibrio magnetotacticus]|uniref:Putative ABC transporter permease n=1 Tax=Fundidesulfovibrio magnetotacticus TaxID=2730080 RepID=A0A6V8LT75_9BACT|nr:FtsX-like permease family protein [Fundidesulfovibrio magnetotacticus]GFK94924.1 putative ABC transporter permease [Fundidesulfovibrio magnetotacticus]